MHVRALTPGKDVARIILVRYGKSLRSVKGRLTDEEIFSAVDDYFGVDGDPSSFYNPSSVRVVGIKEAR